MRFRPLLVAAAAVLLVAGCSSPHRGASPATATIGPTSTSAGTTAGAATGSAVGTQISVPRPAHVVVVVLENHSVDEIVGQSDAPYLAQLASSGAVLTQSYAVTHPSEPNYLALFSGSTQGVANDSCPHQFATPDLGSSLRHAGFSFAGYSESLPSVGFAGCSTGPYARKHAPWVDFTDLPPSTNLPMTRFPTNFTQLPTVSFVIPNLNDDMHDGSVTTADAWLRSKLGGYVAWAPAHDSVLIVTTDEDDGGSSNHIATILVGAHVRPGRYAGRVDHYGVLRTLETAFGLPLLGESVAAAPVPSRVWR